MLGRDTVTWPATRISIAAAYAEAHFTAEIASTLFLEERGSHSVND
jgi:hypothetical protein